MKCTKCGCLMSYQRFYDHADDFDGWRCICCGDIVDDVILSNRSEKKWQPEGTSERGTISAQGFITNSICPVVSLAVSYWIIEHHSQESIILACQEKRLLQDFTSSSFSQVRFRTSTLVNLLPSPSSPSRTTSSLSTNLTTYIFPVVLSLNLSPIFGMAPSPLFTTRGTETGQGQKSAHRIRTLWWWSSARIITVKLNDSSAMRAQNKLFGV